MNVLKLVAYSVLLAGVAAPQTLTAQDLVHLWAFDEPLGFRQDFADSSGNGHAGVGAGDIVPGRFGNAVALLPGSDPATGGIGDGVDWVDPTPEDTALPIAATNSWSINLWTNFDSPPGNLEYIGGFGIDDKESDGNSRRARSIIAFSNFHFWGASVDLDAAMPFPADSQWHMSTVTYDGGTTKLSMYFDGIRVASTTFGGRGPFLDAPAEVHAGNPSNWNEEFAGKIDELGIWNGVLTPGQIGGLFLHNDATQLQELEPTAVVDRSTGQVTLRNLSLSDYGNVAGYQIASAAGSLQPAQWNAVTGRLDQGQGAMPVDSGPWSITSSTALLLAESDQGGAPGVLATGQSIDLGAIWTKSSYEDLVVTLQTFDGVAEKSVDLFVSYTGSAYSRSDLDANGALDLHDWSIFATNGFRSLAELSEVDAARLGDLDGDGDNDRNDFRLFRADYIAANGEAAFAALTIAAPEPATAICMLLLGTTLLRWRPKR